MMKRVQAPSCYEENARRQSGPVSLGQVDESDLIYGISVCYFFLALLDLF